jgi:transcriptional regulator GlxA family with amidase domain
MLGKSLNDVNDPKNQLLCRFRHFISTSIVSRSLPGSRVGDHDALLSAGAAWLPLIGTAGISRRMGSDAPVSNRHDPLATLIGYARENISHRLSIRDLGRHANMSIATLERRIQAQFGITPRLFLSGIRLKEAGRLLKTTSLTISEIADCSGYHSPASFTRAFRRRHGMPPGEFRQRVRPATPPLDINV